MAMNSHGEKTLPVIGIVGIGNPLRTDDGIAHYICTLIEEEPLPNVSAIPVHQLQAELIDTLLHFDVLVFVDASYEGADFQFYRFNVLDHASSSSHHMHPEMLASLAYQLYSKRWDVRICAIRGFQFQIGDQLSEEATYNADKAWCFLKAWIAEGCP